MGLVDGWSPVKRSTFLIAAGVVLAGNPGVVVGTMAMGLTVMSAAIVSAPCASGGESTASCTEAELPALDPAWNVAVPSFADGVGGQAALAAVTAVGRGGRYVAEGNGPVAFACSVFLHLC